VRYTRQAGIAALAAAIITSAAAGQEPDVQPEPPARIHEPVQRMHPKRKAKR
jgi:hypothetical protein